MASEVKTNKVSPATSTTLNVGDSGDTLALAVDSVTGFKVGSDAAGDILYYDGTDYTRREKPGTPADEVLTFATGASAPTWVAAAGGLPAASQWRVTADFTGDAQPIGNSVGTIAVVNTDGYASLGSAMTYGSGVFEFPSTGYWLCLGQFSFTTTVNSGAAGYLEYTANDGVDWSTASWSADASNYGFRSNVNIYHMLNITNKDNQKVRWSIDADITGLGGTQTTMGDAAITETGFTFIKLA